MTDDRHAWMDDAACRHAPIDWFFPPEGRGHVTYGDARRLCRQCPVVDDCLQWALQQVDDDHGMYGGLTPRERRDYRGATSIRRRFERRCRICGVLFMAGTTKAELCSGACRMVSHRRTNLAFKQRQREAS